MLGVGKRSASSATTTTMTTTTTTVARRSVHTSGVRRPTSVARRQHVLRQFRERQSSLLVRTTPTHTLRERLDAIVRVRLHAAQSNDESLGKSDSGESTVRKWGPPFPVQRVPIGERKMKRADATMIPKEWLYMNREDWPQPVNECPETGWKRNYSKRVGVLARKMGMVGEFDVNTEIVPLTVLKVDSQVIQVKNEERDGYSAVQMGIGAAKPKNVSKAMRVHFEKHGVPAKLQVQEFRCTPDAAVEPGTTMSARHFLPGQFVDISGTTIGKGFQGGMKRHGFKGLRASHGVTKAHRKIGSIGASAGVSRVLPGKKMPGRMGNKRRTQQSLLVYRVDAENNLIYIRGSVPGPKNGILRVSDAFRKPFADPPPFPTYQRAASDNDERELTPDELTVHLNDPPEVQGFPGVTIDNVAKWWMTFEEDWPSRAKTESVRSDRKNTQPFPVWEQHTRNITFRSHKWTWEAGKAEVDRAVELPDQAVSKNMQKAFGISVPTEDADAKKNKKVGKKGKKKKGKTKAATKKK